MSVQARVAVLVELHRMVRERIITRFETNFDHVRNLGHAPRVIISVPDTNTRAAARRGRRVQGVLMALYADVTVSVLQDAYAKGVE